MKNANVTVSQQGKDYFVLDNKTGMEKKFDSIPTIADIAQFLSNITPDKLLLECIKGEL